MTTVLHPCLDENGKPVVVAHPTQPTSRDTWVDSRCSATLSRTAEPVLPSALNGLALTGNPGIPDENPWYWRDVVPDAVSVPLQFGQNAQSHLLAEFHAILVKRVDIPDNALNKYLMFIHGNQHAERIGINFFEHDCV